MPRPSFSDLQIVDQNLEWRVMLSAPRRDAGLDHRFAYCYETVGMRRLHLRGRDKMAEQTILDAAGFKIGPLMRVSNGL